MAEEKIRLGGMALSNGVLVHGPTAWACAIRTNEGALKFASARKRFPASRVRSPFLRGPARLAEVFTLLPAVRRRLPEARLPFERPGVLAATLASAVVVRTIRDSTRIGPVAQELLAGLLALAPATISLRGTSLAAYHGAEHMSIGAYEHGEHRPKEHERCGSHLVGPLIGTSVVGAALAARAPEHLRRPARLAASVGALAASTEIFGWMARNPDSPVSR